MTVSVYVRHGVCVCDCVWAPRSMLVLLNKSYFILSLRDRSLGRRWAIPEWGAVCQGPQRGGIRMVQTRPQGRAHSAAEQHVNLETFAQCVRTESWFPRAQALWCYFKEQAGRGKKHKVKRLSVLQGGVCTSATMWQQCVNTAVD